MVLSFLVVFERVKLIERNCLAYNGDMDVFGRMRQESRKLSTFANLSWM